MMRVKTERDVITEQIVRLMDSFDKWKWKFEATWILWRKYKVPPFPQGWDYSRVMWESHREPTGMFYERDDLASAKYAVECEIECWNE